MVAPAVGQFVRLADQDEKLVVTSLNKDESEIDLMTVGDDPRPVRHVAVAELLPGEDLSAG